jgi:hypothetical protein
MEWLKEWWPLGAAAVGTLLGYNTSQNRTAYRLGTLERRVEKAEHDIEVLESSRSADAVTLGIIQASLEQIKSILGDMREEIRSKADK